MTSGVFFLVLASAGLHAFWNFLTRKNSGNVVALGLGLLLGCAALSPVVIIILCIEGFHEAIPPDAIGYMIATGLIHGVYFSFLAFAYEHGEISVVYPTARGSGVGLTALLAWLFLEEQIAFLAAIGIGLIIVGILTIGIQAGIRAVRIRPIILSLCVGISMVAYSLVDKLGVGHVNPVLYIWTMFLTSACFLFAISAWRYYGTIRRTARQYLLHSLIVGVGSIASYLIILFAFRVGAVSYIVATREFAIVLGALAGVLFLKEDLSLPKIIAITAITAGLILIKAS